MPLDLVLLLAMLLLLVVSIGLGWVLLGRLRALEGLRQALGAELAPQLERLERELRGAVQASGQGLRTEQAGQLAQFQQILLNQQAESARTQNTQLDAVSQQLLTLQKFVGDTLVQQVGGLTQSNTQSLQTLQTRLDARLVELRNASDQRLAEMRATVEQRLRELQADNEKKLEQMRATVDEKLHATLEQRLGESFKQVAERLELVHRGLGEMQTLAQGVGDLQRVFSNVKSRGVFGEIQLAGLIEQVFTPEQYGVNVETVPGSGARVEYAIRLPGKGDGPLWLPIDAKFPREDYERLLDAQERVDKPAADAAAKALEQRIRDEARTIQNKYIAAPHTSDFGILFLATEGLYAEALRRPGLVEALQRENRVMLAGPTTLLALLNSLHMGFRTLALEQRSTEVWKVLGAVKTEFAKFGDVLAKTRKKLDEASNTIGAAETRTRAMHRQLRQVEALPVEQSQSLLGLTEVDPEDADDAL
ncbi:MAG: DNA recombination protein RmuC [Betaproteobacteria bacterium]|uniref:DNA recombination protein RmuC homolog n=1 Tax=Thiomonas delicata TaxID=364030 RepID=A0A238D652_THIDL|nr:DNA recombination protein RmuC [Thiomonas delicata]MDE2128049.1 DNA recombination protein RmuC [Betaproteobacteria bacterium]SBP88715.1 DNA recombination protein RmuC homolog [Thiomonas delicata]